jgi:RHS repeat-associated protein
VHRVSAAVLRRPIALFAAVAVLVTATAVLLTSGSLRVLTPAGPQLAAAVDQPAMGLQRRTSHPAPLAPRRARAMHRLERQQARIADRHAAFVATPRARRARERSRVKFRNLAPAAVLAAATHHQGELLSRPTTIAPQLMAGEKISTYPVATGGLVERRDAHGKLMRALVETSGVPIAAADPAHPKAPLKPIDLSLVDAGDHFSPARAAVPVELPKSAADGAAVGAIRVGVTTQPARALVVGGAKTLYPSTARDTDVLLEPQNEGLEVSWMLRSPESPDFLPLALTDQRGAAMDATLDAQGNATLSAGGRTIGTVSAATAWDAQRTPVKATLVMRDGRLGVSVPHADQHLAYPIAVDPFIWTGGTNAIAETDSDTFTFWSGNTNVLGGIADTRSDGLYHRIVASPASGSGRSTWYYDPIRESSAFRAEFHRVSRNAGATCLTLGLWGWNSGYNDTGWGGFWSKGVAPNGDNFTGAASGAFGNCGYDVDAIYVQVCEEKCGWTGGRVTPNNLAQMEVSTAGTTGSGINHEFRDAVVYHRESVQPSVSALTINTGQNGWITGGLSGSVSADDSGIGFCSDRNYYGSDIPSTMTVSGAGVNTSTDYGGCAGFTHLYPATSHVDLGIGDGGRWPDEGSQNLDVTLRDMFGNARTESRTIRVDRTAPTISTGGRLAGYFSPRAGRTGPLPSDIRTLTGAADLSLAVQDSRSGVTTSGVDGTDTASGARIVALDDAGNRVSTPVRLWDSFPACKSGADDCNIPGTRFAPSSFTALPAGLYQLEVDAHDRAGNATVGVYVFAKAGGEINSVVEGQGTARWVPLQASRAAGSPSNATFQWRTGSGSWANVPGDALFTESTNAKVGSATVPMTSGVTGRYVLDLDELVRLAGITDLTAGRILLRTQFDGTGSTYEKLSETVGIRLDRGGRDTSDTTSPIGPGAVDLLTGNVGVSRSDATLPGYQSSIELERTYGSRYGAATGLLGPGWRFGLSEDANNGFVRAVDMDDPARDVYDKNAALWTDATATPEFRYAAVRVEAADGSGFVFEQRESDGAYLPESGFENYSLRRVTQADGATTARFELTDNDSGTITVLSKRMDNAAPGVVTRNGDVEHGTFGVERVTAQGEPGQPTWVYAAANGQMVPSRVVASTDSSLTCPASDPLPAGCRALDLTYTTVAGARRLSQISVVTTDPVSRTTNAPVKLVTYGYDAAGRLTSAKDELTTLTETYGYDGAGLLSTVKPPGRAAFTLAYSSLSSDKTPGRLATVSRPDGAQTNTWTLAYGDRTLNGTNPYDLSTATVAKWDQAVTPFRTAAIFDPMHKPATSTPTTAEAQAATVHYLDALGRTVNLARPVGRIGVTDYDKWGNVTRTLSATGRQWALTQTDTVTAARRRSEYTTYEDDGRGGRRAIRSVGPERDVKTSSGIVRGRSLQLTAYDEGFSASDTRMPYNLVTTARTGSVTGMDALGAGGTQQGMRTTAYSYEKNAADGAKYRTATKMVEQNAAGTALRTTQLVLDADGREIERRQPSNPGTSAAGSANVPTTTNTTYYTGPGTASATSCTGRPEWAGLVCEVGPAAQPTAANLPKLPVKHLQYDVWLHPSKLVETAGTETRTTLTTFDAKNRVSTQSITATSGAAVQDLRHVYDDTTGDELRTEQLTTNGTTDRFVRRVFDPLGRITSYEDSTGGKETTSYDQLDRALVVTDANNGTTIGTQTYGYDATTGFATSIKDSGLDAATAMSATYDPDGRVTSVTYPSGLVKASTYDEEGALTRLMYTKTTNCASACVWFQDAVTRDANGSIADDVSTFSSRTYGYDGLGRLTSASDQTVGSTCSVRTYGYDADSNRLTKRSDTGAAGAACPSGTGGTVITSTYDHDRLATTDGYGLGAAAPTYDAWGRITNLPKQASGGTAVSSTYFVNDLAKSVVNGTVTVSNELDPNGRIRTRTTQTNGQSTVPVETYAYSDDTDAPMFSRTATQAAPGTETGWTRYIEDFSGDLCATVAKSGAKYLEVTNVRGDTVAELAATATATALSAKFAVDEFGVPTGTTMGQRKYGFMGASQRESVVYGQVVSMGVRTYSPWVGRFLQADPVPGGSASAYDYANGDPINSSDPSGLAPKCNNIDAAWTLKPNLLSVGTVHINADICNNGKVKNGTNSGGTNITGAVAGITMDFDKTPSVKYLGGKRGITQITTVLTVKQCGPVTAGALKDACGSYATVRLTIRVSRKGSYRASYRVLPGASGGGKQESWHQKCKRDGKKAGCKSRVK